MRKFLFSFLAFLMLTSLALSINSINSVAFAQPIVDLDETIGKTELPSFADRFHKLSSVDPGADIITSIVFTLIDFMKYLIGAIAVVYLVMSGFNLITAERKIDEVSEKQKEAIKYIIYGLIFIIIADELITKVFFGDYGECLASASNAAECAKVGGSLIKGIYSFILAIIATTAVFVLAISAFRLITSTGDEEVINKQKKRIGMAVIGLIIAAVAEFLVKGILFQEGGTKGINLAAAQKLMYSLTSFVASFIGAVAFVVLFYGGFLYITSAGNDEKTGKAKKIIISAIIGILIALATYGIVVTFTSLPSGEEELVLPTKLPGLP